MKPGKRCKRSDKRAYGSHEEAVRKAALFFQHTGVTAYSAYRCRHCKCWHLTTKGISDQRLTIDEEGMKSEEYPES